MRIALWTTPRSTPISVVHRTVIDEVVRSLGASLVDWVSTTAAAGRTDGDHPACVSGDVDLVLVLGDDGDIARAARGVDGTVPVVGVRTERCGFLGAAGLEDVRSVLEAALAAGLEVEERMMVRVAVTRSGGDVAEWFATHDVLFAAVRPGTTMDVRVRVGGSEAGIYRGHALVLSTATGSTRWAAAVAGVPILSPTVRAVLFVPAWPSAFAARPVVLPADVPVEVEVNRPGARLLVDGEPACLLDVHDHVTARRRRRSSVNSSSMVR